jgi:hypothetical protein
MTALRRPLLVAGWTLVAGAAAVFVAGVLVASHGHLRSQLLLASFGLGLACLMAAVQVGSWSRDRQLVVAGLAAVMASQASFQVLVWTGWKTNPLAWRVWWVTMVAAVHVTHLVLLRPARRSGRDPLVAAAWSTAVVAAVGWASLGLRPDMLGSLPAPLLWLGAIPVLATALLSAAVAWRERPRPLAVGMPSWARWAALVVSHAAVLGAGLYIGRVEVYEEAAVAMPSALAGLREEQIASRQAADLELLQTVSAGLGSCLQDMQAVSLGLRSRRQAEGRDYLLPGEDDDLRWRFVTYLSYRTALLRLVTTHSGFEAVRDPALAARSFLLGYAAALEAYRRAIELDEIYRADPLERRKLNEPEPSWGLPAGMFDRVGSAVGAQRHAQLCEEMAAYYLHRRQRWRREHVWDGARLEWLEAHIQATLRAVRGRRVEEHRRWLEAFVDRVRSDAYTPVYAVQATVAEWIGDIRIVERPRFVDPTTIAEIVPLLRPGDILLERRSWHASNAFLPGFWPHVALYVGDLQDLERLGIADEPEVVSRLESFLGQTPDGHPYRVIEALGEGVIFNTVEHSLHADHVAVLRPRLGEPQIATAIVTAFRHQGKPYDFQFDFFTADRLVCTELVYRAYRDLLRLDLVRIMGRDTLPAIELVRKYARELGAPGQELDLVLFLDGDPACGCAVEADEATFIASADRMREFNE